MHIFLSEEVGLFVELFFNICVIIIVEQNNYLTDQRKQSPLSMLNNDFWRKRYMNTLKVEKRNMQTKTKKLRREGFVTGNVFGKELKNSIPIQMGKHDAEELLKNCQKGSQVIMELEGEKRNVLIKEIDIDSMKHQILEIDFQMLVKGEQVHSVAEIVLLNHDKVVNGIVELDLPEIAYVATPEALVEKIEIDLEKMRVGDEILVKDLPIASNKKITLKTNLNESVVRIVEPHTVVSNE